jgi:hypothetical protein
MDIRAFHGLNNVSDPLRVGLGWLSTANNVNITDTGAVAKRKGYSLSRAGAYTGGYSTLDFSRMYLVKGLAIEDANGVVVSVLTSTDPMFWTEVNEQVFYNNGTDSGIILPDNSVIPWRWASPPTPTQTMYSLPGNPAATYQAVCTTVLPDGRETGTGTFLSVDAPDGMSVNFGGATGTFQNGQVRGTILYTTEANGSVFQSPYADDLRVAFTDPLPVTSDVIQHWKGRIYAAQFMPSDNQTVVWFSEPLAYHLYNLNSNFFIVPGHVHMLAPTDDALIVGTDKKVFAYSIEKLDELALYGVVPGQHWSTDLLADGNERLLFWTTRGLCSAMPFTNLTERQVSVAPGVHAGGTIVRSGGQKRYVVALQQGGSAFSSYI